MACLWFYGFTALGHTETFLLFFRYIGIIVCVIRVEFRSTNTDWEKRRVVCSCLNAIFLTFIIIR